MQIHKSTYNQENPFPGTHPTQMNEGPHAHMHTGAHTNTHENTDVARQGGISLQSQHLRIRKTTNLRAAWATNSKPVWTTERSSILVVKGLTQKHEDLSSDFQNMQILCSHDSLL